LTLPNLNGLKPLPLSGPFWATPLDERNGPGQANAAPALLLQHALRGSDLRSLSPCLWSCETDNCGCAGRAAVRVSRSHKPLMGNFGILSPPPPGAVISDQVVHAGKGVLAVQDHWMSRKMSLFDSRTASFPERPSRSCSANDVHIPSASKVDADRPPHPPPRGARVYFKLPRVLKSMVAQLKSGKQKLG